MVWTSFTKGLNYKNLKIAGVDNILKNSKMEKSSTQQKLNQLNNLMQ
jgi:hypothetical protein